MLNDYAQLDRRVLEESQTARPTLYPVILFLGRPLGGQIEGKGVRKDTAGGQSFRVSRDAILRHDEHGLFSQAD